MEASRVSDNHMPNHRRSDDTEDGQGHRLQSAVESTFAKSAGRLVTPMLLTALLGISTFIGSRLVSQLDDQGHDISKIKGDLVQVSARLDEGVIRQVNDNGKRIDKIEDRVTVLERSVRTP